MMSSPIVAGTSGTQPTDRRSALFTKAASDDPRLRAAGERVRADP